MKTIIKIGRWRLGYQMNSIPDSKAGRLSYRCNICDCDCETKMTGLGREKPSCPNCQSTVRFRAVIHLLSTELFGDNLTLPNFPAKPDIRGVGLSDWLGYAEPLAAKLNYTNTFYHQAPKLDIMAIDPSLENTLDFLISSDVFEHVAPPLSVAFENAYKLLKPGGVMILTVPYMLQEKTIEHFPELYQYEIIRQRNQPVLKNLTRAGREQVFDNLVFHGGDGETLEMRLCSETSLREEFAKAGFERLRICREPDFEHGIYWAREGSLPMTARKPGNPSA